MEENKKVLFHTLGCKLNFSETSTLARQFEDNGFKRMRFAKDGADIHVINSCSVTENADKKCRYLIRKIHRDNPNAIIAVTGCYAQLKPQEISEIEGVDIVIGNNSKGDLVSLVKNIALKGDKAIFSCDSSEITNFFASFSSGDRTRAFLKVQDGCDYHCAYCTIPLARGNSRNAPIEEIVKQANDIAKKGIKEIVITGVNTGDFGRTTGEKFIDLIKELDRVDGIERYRISSIEPNLLTDEILSLTTSSKKFQPHYHIPLQAGTNYILNKMRRRYTVELFAEKILAIKKSEDDVFIGIDVIVGFPGETNSHFEQTYKLLEELKPSFLHIFPYSERANTPAAEFPDSVDVHERHQRVERLTLLSNKLHKEFCCRFIDKEVEVLVEGFRKGGIMYGYTSNYVKVEMPYKKEFINTIIKARINSVDDKCIAQGELI